MRVLFLNHNVVDSGTFFRAFHFGKQLSARGHQVTLMTTSRHARIASKSYERDGVEIIEAPDLLIGRGRTGWCPYNTQVRRQLVRRREFDVVHAFDSRPTVIYPALSAVQQSKALFVMDWADWWGRGGWIHDRSGWAVRTFFGPIETWFEEAYRRRPDGMTVISSALAERTRALGVAAERIRRIPQGCDIDAKPLQQRAAARAQLGVSQNTRVLLHVGVLTPGDYGLLKAAYLRARAEHGDALLVVAGRTGMRVLSEAGNAILVTGALSETDLDAWLAAANACVIPCRDTVGNRGRWPSKVNTYLSGGRAVVMPQVGDVGALLRDTRSGWTTDTTVDAFAAGIAAALQSPEAADAAGARGRAAAAEQLAWSRLTDDLLGFYQQLSEKQ